jgi:hypothetical protein
MKTITLRKAGADRLTGMANPHSRVRRPALPA